MIDIGWNFCRIIGDSRTGAPGRCQNSLADLAFVTGSHGATAETQRRSDCGGGRRYCGRAVEFTCCCFGVTKPTIAKICFFFIGKMKKPQKQIVDTEERLAALPLSGRLEAIELADELRAISRNLAGSADTAALPRFALSAIAGKQVER